MVPAFHTICCGFCVISGIFCVPDERLYLRITLKFSVLSDIKF